MAAEKPKAPNPKTSPAPASEPAVVEAQTEGPFPTSWYWFTFIVSLVSLVILWLYYGGFGWVRILFWVGVVLAVGLAIWSTGGLMTRYNVVERVGSSAAKFRDDREATPDGDQQVVYRENILIRTWNLLWRLVTLLFLFVWNTFLRLLFIAELIILYTFLIAYDILYWVLYFAWTVTIVTGRLALRITGWALRVAWTILRILTMLPIARKIWANRWRPSIMGKYHHRVERLAEQKRLYVERKRRFAALKGKDPDKWQKDWELRRHFPLPHPHEGRKGLRDRIEERKRLDYNRRDRWAAYRQGRPMPPKLHSERKKHNQQVREEQRHRKREAMKESRGGPKETIGKKRDVASGLLGDRPSARPARNDD
ncbi:MAG TPA: hypothetical protein VI818_01065 [Candidatus Thermoplasmatota archaeon]|nr:hypothetical protein [Candidatus Thermoplasmatota archaeon]